MHKVLLLGLVLLCNTLPAVQEDYKAIKESIDSALVSLEKKLSTVNAPTDSAKLFLALKNQVAELKDARPGTPYPFLGEYILQRVLNALMYCVNDRCIPPGSGKTLLTERFKELQNTLVVYSSLLYNFLRKIESLPLTINRKTQLQEDYLHALNRQALHLHNLIKLTI